MAIDLANKLKIQITLLEHNNASYNFMVNSIPAKKVMYFGLLDTLTFDCKIFDGAVEIVKITINDKEILPIYQHLARPATNWITTDWQFTILEPFYPWYHQITGQGWIA